MGPDGKKLIKWPEFTKTRYFHKSYMQDWSSDEEYMSILEDYNETDVKNKHTVEIPILSDEKYICLKLNNYTCYLLKSKYSILCDLDLHLHFEKVFSFSEIVYETDSGTILKFNKIFKLKDIIDKLLPNTEKI